MGETDIYEQLGRLMGMLEGQNMRLEQIAVDIRGLPCRSSPPSCPTVPARKPPSSEQRSNTGGGYPRVTKADLENTAKMAIMQAEEAAERTVEERLEALETQKLRLADRRRESVRGWLQIVQLIVAIAAGAGVAGALQCRMDPSAATVQHKHTKQAAPMPARAVDMRR